MSRVIPTIQKGAKTLSRASDAPLKRRVMGYYRTLQSAKDGLLKMAPVAEVTTLKEVDEWINKLNTFA